MNTQNTIEKILKLKKEKNAVILAHFYQIPEIQDIADFIGDSLNLAEAAKNTKSDLILFCGVHFMGETAKILNPQKKVIIPDMNAGCSLADSCPEEEFKNFKEQNPDHLVISYINCSAKIKTLSDIICTSGNALQLVNSLPKDQKIIFAPDKNLGGYLNRITGRNMVLWNGTCEVHELLTAEYVLKQKIQHPDYTLIAHPECNDAVLQISDFIGSTAAMINFVKTSTNKKFLVATESGIVHQLKKDNPDKEFLIVTQNETCSCNDCRYMKLNTLEKVLASLEEEKYEIILDDDLIEKAKKPIIKMLDISKELGIIK
ncbi:MAG: quinolinate synthase NadA [Bacteroidales bacterium]|jgi:quinolinate synthase